jgi:hypothetical protein
LEKKVKSLEDLFLGKSSLLFKPKHQWKSFLFFTSFFSLFNSLALASETGLPVHVNSFFEMSSNRRDLWKGSHSMDTDSSIKSKWNEALIEEILGPSYTELLYFIQRKTIGEKLKP